MIDDEAFARLDVLLLSALDLPPQDRSAYLDKACGDNASLRAELDVLIAGAEQQNFLDQPAFELVQPTLAPSATVPPAGSRFVDTARFQIRQRLGEGGFGVVYEAYDNVQKKLVALKVLYRSDPGALVRFKNEFRRLANIRHAHLVDLYEFFCERRQWFFSMELIDGVNFRRYVSDQQEPPSGDGVSGSVDRLREASWQLAHGIAALHAHGIIHRDIKPSNVLVTADGQVRLLDFGLVQEIRAGGHHRRTVAGTVGYMAPEQLAGQALDESADWYSFGVMLIEALTGTLPSRRTERDPFSEPAGVGVPEDLKQLCRSLLREDPAARPTGSEVIACVGGPGPRPVMSVARRRLSEVLIGRESHLAELDAALALVQDGQSAVVNVYGRSGMGKSALLRAFHERLHSERPDVVVLAGRCSERETISFNALDQLVDRLADYLRSLPENEANALIPRDAHQLARAFPVLAEIGAMSRSRQQAAAIPDSREARLRAFASLQELLGRLAEKAILVLSIDDVQWGDLDSSAFFAQLFRGVVPTNLLLIASYRSEDRDTSPFLRAWQTLMTETAAVKIRGLEVGELTTEQSRLLAERLLEIAPLRASVAATMIVNESGGSPFLTEQLVRHVTGTSSDDATHVTVEHVIAQRVAGLSPPAQRLLEVIAIAGEPIAESMARAAAGTHDRGHLAVLLDERLARIRETSHHRELEIYHDRIREAVTAAIPIARRRLQHLALAEAFAIEPRSNAAALAIHLMAGGDTARAAAHAAQAGDLASEALAFDRAAMFYRSALDSGGWNPEAALALQRKLAAALVHLGRGGEAAQVYLNAALASSSSRTELRRLAAEQLLRTGHLEQGVSLLEEIAGELHVWLPNARWQTILSLIWHRARLACHRVVFRQFASKELQADRVTVLDLYWSLVIGLALLDPIRSMDFHSRHMLGALQTGDERRQAKSLAIEAAHQAALSGQSKTGIVALLSRAGRTAHTSQDPAIRGLVHTMHAVCALMVGNWPEALRAAEEAEEMLRRECTGVAWETTTCLQIWSTAAFHLGAWSRLRHFGTRVAADLEEGRKRGDVHMLQASFPLGCSIAFASVQPRAIERLSEEMQSALPKTGFLLPHLWIAYVNALAALLSGEPQRAWTELMSQWPAIRRSLLLRLPYVAICAFEARARVAIAIAATNHDPKTDYLNDALHCAGKLKSIGEGWGYASALLVEAGVASVQRRTAAAIDLLKRAEEGYRTGQMAHLVATCQYCRGTLLGEAGSDLVEAALTWSTSEGVVSPRHIFAMLAPGDWSATEPTRP